MNKTFYHKFTTIQLLDHKTVQLGLNLKLTRKFTFVVCKVKINVIVEFQTLGSKIILLKHEIDCFDLPTVFKSCRRVVRIHRTGLGFRKISRYLSQAPGRKLKPDGSVC